MVRNDYEAYSRDQYLAHPDDLNREEFPLLLNISSAFLYTLIPRPTYTSTPEFVYIDSGKVKNTEVAELFDWNLAWEAGHLRQKYMFPQLRSAPCPLPRGTGKKKQITPHHAVQLAAKLGTRECANLYLLPFNRKHHYHSYSALFHLIPRRTLQSNGLPLLRKGDWPLGWFRRGTVDEVLPNDFDDRLAQAFSFHIWPLINSGSKASSFSKEEPLRVLSHNLDFWLPSIFKVVENRLNRFERVAIEGEEQLRKIEEAKLLLPPEVEPVRPLKGGVVWAGETDAWQATREMVELADSNGKLRAIIDAIRSNRVEEDFSDRWSREREDFERKLYKKRAKIKVTFVEITDTVPVHGPDSEFHEDLLWEDFFGILHQREKRIVVCLRNGITKLGDIANEMGYANHSPVSKALNKIREKARKFLAGQL